MSSFISRAFSQLTAGEGTEDQTKERDDQRQMRTNGDDASTHHHQQQQQQQQQEEERRKQREQQRQILQQSQQKTILFLEWTNQGRDDLYFAVGSNQGFAVEQVEYERTKEPYESRVTEISQKDFSMTEKCSGVGICHLIFEQPTANDLKRQNVRMSTSNNDLRTSRSRSSSTASIDAVGADLGSTYPRIVVFVGGGSQPVSDGNIVNFFDLQAQKVISDVSFATEVVGISSCVVQCKGIGGHRVVMLSISLENQVKLFAIPIGGGRDTNLNLVSQLQKKELHSFFVKDYPRGSGSRLHHSAMMYSSASSLSTSSSSSTVAFGPNIMETSRSLCKLMSVWEEVEDTSSSTRSSMQQFFLLAFPHVEKGKVQIEKFQLVADTQDHKTRLKSVLSVIFQAHENAIGHIILSPCGKMMATTSQKGTRIRVYSINTTPSLLKDFKRGMNNANIYSLVFDHNSDYLCCTSDRNTLHVYTLSPDKNQHYQALHKHHGYLTPQRGLLDTLSTYVSGMIQESSIAQYHIPPPVQRSSSTDVPIPSIACFHPQNPNIVNVITGDGRLLVLYFNYDLENWIHMLQDYSQFEQLTKPVTTEKHQFCLAQDASLAVHTSPRDTK